MVRCYRRVFSTDYELPEGEPAREAAPGGVATMTQATLADDKRAGRRRPGAGRRRALVRWRLRRGRRRARYRCCCGSGGTTGSSWTSGRSSAPTARRSLGYLDGHNGHWITLLRLDYRLNFELWGLRSYLPYQIPAVLGHLASAVLLRQVCRRVGARGWIATATALAFLFFGTGRENMTLGFQVSLTGSLICGFGLFLLAEGPKVGDPAGLARPRPGRRWGS